MKPRTKAIVWAIVILLLVFHPVYAASLVTQAWDSAGVFIHNLHIGG